MKRIRPWWFMAVFACVWVGRMAIYPYLDSAITDPFVQQLVSESFRITLWILLPLLWLRIVEKRSITDVFHPCDPLTPNVWPWLALSLFGVILGSHRVLKYKWHGIASDLTFDAYFGGALSIGVVAIAEEFLFRGVFLSGLLRRGWRFGVANLLTSWFFTLSHWPGWLMAGPGLSATDVVTASLRIFGFGLLMGGLVRLEGGLIGAIVVHGFNNLIAGSAFRGS